MDTEEVSQRGRDSSNTSGKATTNDYGDSSGFFALCLAIFLVTTYKSIKGLPVGDVISLPFVFLSVGMFARHRRDHGRFTLTFGIVCAVIAVLLVGSFIVATW